MSNVDVEKDPAVLNRYAEPATLDRFTSGVSVNRTETRRQGPMQAGRTKCNPGPLGMFCYAGCTLLLSLLNARVRGIDTATLILGMAFGFGGISQLIAGIFEYCNGNIFGFTAFCAYGGFWISVACLHWPSTNMIAAYPTDHVMFNDALGLYMMVWFVITTILVIGAIRTNLFLFLSLFALALTFLLLGIGHFQESIPIGKAGGYAGIIAAVLGFYDGAGELYEEMHMPFHLPNPALLPDPE